jgi:hypothetical protein
LYLFNDLTSKEFQVTGRNFFSWANGSFGRRGGAGYCGMTQRSTLQLHCQEMGLANNCIA